MRVISHLECEPIFRYSGIKFFVRQAVLEMGDGVFTVSRGVIKAGDGANVLPYFWDNGWKVVMVRQARVAPCVVTIEPPGGKIDYRDFEDEDGFTMPQEHVVKSSMAKELKEEVGIIVQPEKIILVFAEHYLPPLLEGVAWGGVVEINKSDLPASKMSRHLGQEHTEIAIFGFQDLIEKKENEWRDSPVFDLWTSRLLDEVGKIIRAPRRS